MLPPKPEWLRDGVEEWRGGGQEICAATASLARSLIPLSPLPASPPVTRRCDGPPPPFRDSVSRSQTAERGMGVSRRE